MTKAYQRKRFFLWNTSQPRVLAGMEIIFFILLVITGAAFAVIAGKDLTASYFAAHLGIRNTLDILIPSLVVINLIGLAASMILAVFFTHRIAGPVYRLCNILKKIGQGDLAQTIHFRKGDEFRELESAATEMKDALQNRIRTLKILSSEINLQVGNMPGVADQPEFSQLRRNAEEMDQLLATFRLPNLNATEEAK